MLSRPSKSDTPLVIHLSSISAYSTFGELLRAVRNHHNTTYHENLSPQKITDALNPLLEKAGEKGLAKRAYADLESGRRYPRFIELELIFRVLVETFYVEFTNLEIPAYKHLARQKIEQNQKLKQSDKVSDADWEALEARLFSINQSKPGHIHVVTDAKAQSEPSALTEDPHSRRLQAVEKALRTDTRHLLEREEWVTKMLKYPKMDTQVKLVIVQGAIGVGKSSATALLTQRFVDKSPSTYLIPYLFQSGEGKTSEDHLDEFLATILADLTLATVSGETKQQPLADRIRQVLTALKSRQDKVVFLLDDAQYIFPAAGEWSAAWREFLEAFVRESHHATLYLFTRTWPGWDERRLVYIEQSELLDLSPTASVKLWQDRGFDDVPETTLREVCARCGHNPQMMEMLMAQGKKRFFTSNRWDQGILSSQNDSKKSTNTRRLEAVLAQDTIFDLTMDVKSKAVLQQALTGSLNHQARQMLESLSLSPLGLPFSLLLEEFAHADIALSELASVSAIDLNMAAAQRAAIIPFVQEAVVLDLTNDGRKNGVESRVTDLYTHWLHNVQDFRDDSEKSALIAEMVVRYTRSRQFLKAAELFIGYGWLCVLFGHTSRIERVFSETSKAYRGQVETAEQEAGRLLLQHRIAVHCGQEIKRDERDQIYQDVYKKIVAGEVALRPHAELAVLHNMRLLYSRGGLLAEAGQMFDQAFAGLQESGQMKPEVHASFLFEKAQLHLSWSEQYPSDALYHIQIAADTLEESVTQWRLCLKNALPLQEHYVNFELARALNDNAYALRELERYPEAQQAIEESIKLKKSNAALPHSIAIAQSELAQILLCRGLVQQSKVISAQAVQLLEQAVNDGDRLHQPELGMLLVERADILWEQAELVEALPLLERAVPLFGDKPSRQSYKQRAIKQIDEIRLIINSKHPYQLDRRWFPRYSDLVAYDDLFLLTQAGPFTQDEQREWTQLFSNRDDEESQNRLLELAAQSRKREFSRCSQENCIPTICYPCLSAESMIKDIQERSQGLAELRKDIETHEKNVVVRRLYLDAIDEQLTVLSLIEAVALKDQEKVWHYNLQFYGKPSERELKIALQVLYATILEARYHPLAGPVAQDILAQLKEWGLSLSDIASEDLFTPQQEATRRVDRKTQIEEKQLFPAIVVRKFFQDVLKTYGARNWKVEISPARDYTYVDPNERKLVLPQKSFSVGKIRQLLAEEIETHTFRALAGLHSSLALLGLGLARQEATEEGLAKWYVRHSNRQVGAEEKENTWIGTLSSGLVSGVLTPALSFKELQNFLEKYYLLHRLLEEEETQEKAITIAKQSAWARACRTFRGVPDLSRIGCCSLKDVIYLRGHLEISRYFDLGGDEQRLWVGAVGVEHLENLAELNILTPNFPHRHLALAADLAKQLSQYKE